MRISTRIAGSVAGLALALGSFSAASAASEEPAPCEQQQTHVDKAVVALAKVTAVFQRQQDKVKTAKDEVKDAATAAKRADAKEHVSKVKAKLDHTAKAKKAQQQRLAKAQERLATCLAEQPPAA